MTFRSEQEKKIEKKRHYGKKILDIGEFFIQCNTDNCCEHITVGVDVYL